MTQEEWNADIVHLLETLNKTLLDNTSTVLNHFRTLISYINELEKSIEKLHTENERLRNKPFECSPN